MHILVTNDDGVTAPGFAGISRGDAGIWKSKHSRTRSQLVGIWTRKDITQTFAD